MKKILKVTGVMLVLFTVLNVSTRIINTQSINSKLRNSSAIINQIPNHNVCIDPDSERASCDSKF